MLNSAPFRQPSVEMIHRFSRLVLRAPTSAKPLRLHCTLSDSEKISQIRAGIAPATGRPLAELARDVWGYSANPAGPGHRSGLKILRRPLKGPLYASWYPEPLSANPLNPIRLTDKQERWRKKLKMLRASGKGPPKKGAGKRSK